MSSNRVEWEDVEAAAKVAFAIWVDQPELIWAKRAWQTLADGDLTGFDDERGRHIVLLRFLALAGIYSDFCNVAWEEGSGRNYGYWCEPLDLSDFVLGQLSASPRDTDEAIDSAEALVLLTEAQRATVVKVLLNQLGGVNELYASLWRSTRPDLSDDDLAQSDGSLFISGLMEGPDPWFPVSVHRHAAFEWVSEGCPQCG
jgi:hypothetical protein